MCFLSSTNSITQFSWSCLWWRWKLKLEVHMGLYILTLMVFIVAYEWKKKIEYSITQLQELYTELKFVGNKLSYLNYAYYFPIVCLSLSKKLIPNDNHNSHLIYPSFRSICTEVNNKSCSKTFCKIHKKTCVGKWTLYL